MANNIEAGFAILHGAASCVVAERFDGGAVQEGHFRRRGGARQQPVEFAQRVGRKAGLKILPILFERHRQWRDQNSAALQRDARDQLIGAFRERRQNHDWRRPIGGKIVLGDTVEDLANPAFKLLDVFVPRVAMPRHADNERHTVTRPADVAERTTTERPRFRLGHGSMISQERILD